MFLEQSFEEKGTLIFIPNLIKIFFSIHIVEVSFEVVYCLFLIQHCSGFQTIERINMIEYPHPLS